ncbi:DNA methyltransferase [Campylobacter upsaliensis]|nr:adenine-specific methyltransferase EcoRI family protein [Campylobacter upsaliensis]EAI9907127.1 DNA methyltransferase [Campylobacter upsaliensis]EAJ0879700.1 DNA methyltransferase [Campylobacter upsaliensis]EAL3987007.1 DNA methyltransferase [Campylobacter upsaliensis]EAL5620606.1 DNA methyltransferase [Campylobacter upsaliensis]EHB5117677.1 DNA methyltransferase [Campylobacter upsaliensis]
MKQYLYIAQGSLEPSKCKIGITNDLNRRLKEYNSTTGISAENSYSYLFAAEVSDMKALEQDIKNRFFYLREQESREIYFYNPSLFEMYVSFIWASPYFLKKVALKENKKSSTIKPKTQPTMEERGIEQRIEILNRAKRVKDDEFYTRMEDIEAELAMYPTKIWKDKVVFCNCDDAVGERRDYADTSAFALYFLKHFFRLKLKKLICTHYGGPVDLFNTRTGPRGYIFTREGVTEMRDSPNNYTGSFDSELSLKILNEEADIVCTNPPFSRAIDYWKVLIKSKKKFIIISNVTIPISTAFIPYFMQKKAWAGYTSVDWYLNLKRIPVRAAGHFFTNFPIKDRPAIKRLKFVPLNEIPDVYQRYDDSGTLLVDNNFIPNDYDKPFAVSTRQILNGVLECGYEIVSKKQYEAFINGKSNFKRVLIQKIKEN